MKIITITFSPCIDKTTSVPDFIPEKKLRCAPPVLEAGGGGINVSRALVKLGGQSIAIYPSGGCTGALFDKLLAKDKVTGKIVRAVSETRENFIVVKESTGEQYRFGMPGTHLAEHEWKEMIKMIEEENEIDFIVASGSLPPGVPLDIYAKIASIAKNKNAKFIVDTSGEALKHAINEGVFLAKPNLNELGALTGKPVANGSQIIEAARQLLTETNCQVVVVSMGGAGALFVTEDHAEKISVPKVDLKSTVGAGDSMVAGIVLYLSQGASLPDAVQYGLACGTAATMNPGTELCKKVDADDLYKQIREMSHR
ncbi:MAG: 1-phosphofructokinase family hexose kinase [Chitinophagaceae bacterium]|nr:1-phosphofructokinase family hexose kinase [Chitinophagaceae bacterium]